MRFRLRTLLILLAIVALLITVGLIPVGQRGVGRAIRDVNRLAPEIDQRNHEVENLAAP